MTKTPKSQTETVHAQETEELSETDLESVVGGAFNAYLVFEPAPAHSVDTTGKKSPGLMQGCATGEHIKEATITVL